MIFEIRRIAPLKTANVLAVVAAVVLTVFSLPFVALLLFTGPMPAGPNPKDREWAEGMMLFMLALYPVMGAICGWLAGLIGSSAYNVLSRRMGGIKVVMLAED